ncbi:hypothetical protein Tco_0952645 [Tanacetum coccineum]|uniref:Reverse transcriptase zinc-binding domain-containing protein n=1 Tax=Tanacetum coccineum TaxID=301880 RepID=A0ABQ5DXY0_9ASTR
MEGLNFAISDAVHSEWISHNMDNIIRVLRIFYLASGLKINIHKSNVYGIGVSAKEVRSMANNMGFVSGSFPFVYLRLPVGCNMNLTSNWKLLIDRMHSNPNVLWVKVVKSLHASEGGFDQNGCKSNGIWAKIVSSSNHFHSRGIPPVDYLCFCASCGTLIRFWKDTWIGSSPLYLRYDRLFRLEQDKDYPIIDRIHNGQWSWNWTQNDLGVRNSAYLRDLLIEILAYGP